MITKKDNAFIIGCLKIKCVFIVGYLFLSFVLWLYLQNLYAPFSFYEQFPDRNITILLLV